jgi:polysaccharide deacetylase 2 family uncharacterized protein YibQ
LCSCRSCISATSGSVENDPQRTSGERDRFDGNKNVAAGIDHALGRLEMAAQERSIAVGISSALPVSIDHIAKWAKAAEAAACS